MFRLVVLLRIYIYIYIYMFVLGVVFLLFRWFSGADAGSERYVGLVSWTLRWTDCGMSCRIRSDQIRSDASDDVISCHIILWYTTP